MFILDYSVHEVHTNLKFNLSKIIFAYSTVLQVEKKDQSFTSHSKACELAAITYSLPADIVAGWPVSQISLQLGWARFECLSDL